VKEVLCVSMDRGNFSGESLRARIEGDDQGPMELDGGKGSKWGLPGSTSSGYRWRAQLATGRPLVTW
jgi:predicted secreted protein